MGKKKSIRKKLEDFISSDRGQRFFNFSYSIGAAVVIWGALFKILHLPGGDTLLTIGMGTEVIMFFLTAFDRPPMPAAQIVQATSEPDNSTGVPSAAASPGNGESIIVEDMKGVIDEMSRLREAAAALNTLYELQIKSVSSQLGTIDDGNRNATAMREMMAQSVEQNRRYCDETMKMTENMARLNSIYECMIAAMSSAGNASTNR